MDILSIIIAGVAGTYVMTLFMSLAALLTGFNFHVPRILGTLITFRTKPSGAVSNSALSVATGYCVHYLIGILFVPLYQQLFLPDGDVTVLKTALLFGVVAGVAAVGFWALVLKLHPLAPAVNLKLYLPLIFFGHILFAAGMHYTLLLFPS